MEGKWPHRPPEVGRALTIPGTPAIVSRKMSLRSHTFGDSLPSCLYPVTVSNMTRVSLARPKDTLSVAVTGSTCDSSTPFTSSFDHTSCVMGFSHDRSPDSCAIPAQGRADTARTHRKPGMLHKPKQKTTNRFRTRA